MHVFRNKTDRNEEKHSDSQKVMKRYQQQYYQFCVGLKFTLGKMIKTELGKKGINGLRGCTMQ